jgi:hypothetical protein
MALQRASPWTKNMIKAIFANETYNSTSNLSPAREPWGDLNICGYLYYIMRRSNREVTTAIQRV